MTVTEVVTSTGADKVIVKLTPLPSVAEALAMLKNALSLSAIVPVPVPLTPEIATFLPAAFRPPSERVKDSVPSTWASFVVLTEIVCDVTPAANVTV